jgi:branched-chain amino acid transport system substrate-binding protein
LLTKLGPKLNGLVDFGFWVPEPSLKFPGIEAFLKKYQAEAEKAGVDPLGYYLPPWAYAMMEVLGQAIESTKSIDQQKVAETLHAREFDTIVGKVKFGADGEWTTSRILLIQFQNIKGTDQNQFTQPGKQVVVYPEALRSGPLIYPYSAAQR